MTNSDSDKELVEKAKQGDLRAFDMLVLKYQRRVFRLISRLIKNTSEVEDVAQETFIKAFRAIQQFRGDIDQFKKICGLNNQAYQFR